MEGFWFTHGVQFLMNDREYIVREERENDIVIEDVSYKQIKTVAVADLLLEWTNGTLQFPSGERERQAVHDDIEQYTADELQEINRRFAIIEPFITGRKRECSVEQYLTQLPSPKPSRATFYRWLARYNKRDDKRYLSPRHDQRGPRERRPDPEVFNMLLGILNSNTDGGFYSGTDMPIYSVYTTLSKKVKDVNVEREPKDKLHMMSKDTVYRIVHEVMDAYRKNVVRHGKVAADLKKHGVTTTVLTARPLERVEVDWTQLDMFIVDTGTFKRERLYLIYAIDQCTSYPLGFHITFDEPTAVDIKQCLLHAILPKTYIKQYYPEVKNEWDAWGNPEEIVVDNAKVFESRDLEDVLELCGIDLQYCHVTAAHQKGTVERGLQDVNSIIHQMPGSVFSNPQERSRYDSEGKATVTLIGLYRIMHVLLVDRIAHAIHHDYGMTPHQMWVQRLKDIKVRRTLPYSKQSLKLMFGSSIEMRRIENKGVVISRQWFQSDELQELRQRLENKTGESHPKVRLRFDSADMRTVYVYDPDYERYILARTTINSLEKKGIDENYPVHYQQLADHSLSVSRGIRDFDVTQLADADETLYKIIKDDRALLRGVSRLEPNESEEMGAAPVVSLVSLQLEESSLNPVADLDTLDDVTLAESDSSRSVKDTSSTEPDADTAPVDFSSDPIETVKKEHQKSKPRKRKPEHTISDSRYDGDNDFHNGLHESIAIGSSPDDNENDDDDWNALYLVPQRGI